MPILDVEVVLRPGESLPPDLPGTLARLAAQVFGTPPGRTWVKLKPLLPQLYAEDGDAPPEGVYPVFVRVLKARRPSPKELEAEVVGLTHAIARACARPAANVHVLYEPEAKGRLAFGGNVVSG